MKQFLVFIYCVLAIQSIFVRHTRKRAVRWATAPTYEPRHGHERGAVGHALALAEDMVRHAVIFSSSRVSAVR